MSRQFGRKRALDKAERDEILAGTTEVVLQAISWVARGIFALSLLGILALAIWLGYEISIQ